VLDRKPGELLSAKNYAPVNWASHVDLETGKPVLTEDSQYFDEPKVIWPAQVGAHGWRPMAYNKVTRLAYIPVYESANMRVNLFPDGYEYKPGKPSTGVVGFAAIGPVVDFYASVLPPRYTPQRLKDIINSYDVPKTRGVLKAWNPVTQTVVWEADAGGERNDGGILTTAGNLVIYGKSSGQLVVRSATTGELLHEVDLGTGIMAAPMTYSIDGEQYVAVMAGLGGGGFFRYPHYSAAYKRTNKGRLIAFKLGGGATTMAEVEPELHFPEPPKRTGTPKIIKRGNEQFLWYCAACHNNAGRGTVPDLRYLGAGKHLVFDQIVREGLLSSQGMPQFADILSKADTDAIQSYLIDQAWMSYSRHKVVKETSLNISTH
jgi:quinohemoprotein ethanol dehydrogenase